MQQQMFPFSSTFQTSYDGVTFTDTRADWSDTLPSRGNVNQLVVLTEDLGTSPAGLYVYDAKAWHFVAPYLAMCDRLAVGGAVIIYGVQLPADVAVDLTKVMVWKNGSSVVAGDLPGAVIPAANPYYWVTVGIVTAGGGGGGYTLPAATASALGGVKVGTGLTVAGDGTLSRTALVAADIPNLDAGKITTGTLTVARLPVATAAALGAAQAGTGLAVAAGVFSVAAVGATAGNIGGVTRQAAIANLSAAPTQGDINGILAALRLAGILA